jgi:hypothetical protein
MGVGYRLDHSVPPFWHRSDIAQYLNLTPFAGLVTPLCGPTAGIAASREQSHRSARQPLACK